MARVGNVQVRRVGVHALNLLLNSLGIVREIDAVAKAFRHFFLAVSTGKATLCGVLGQHERRFNEHRSVCLVEAADEFARQFNHRCLVFTCRNRCRFESSDVGCLRNGVAKEAERDRVVFETTHLYFGLHRGVALYAAHTDDVHQVGCKLAQLGNTALYVERTLVRVEPCRQIVEGNLHYILPYFFRIVGVIRQCLHVSHKYKHALIVAFVLKLHAAAQTSHIVSQVEFAGRTVACQYNFSHNIMFLFSECKGNIFNLQCIYISTAC